MDPFVVPFIAQRVCTLTSFEASHPGCFSTKPTIYLSIRRRQAPGLVVVSCSDQTCASLAASTDRSLEPAFKAQIGLHLFQLPVFIFEPFYLLDIGCPHRPALESPRVKSSLTDAA